MSSAVDGSAKASVIELSVTAAAPANPNAERRDSSNREVSIGSPSTMTMTVSASARHVDECSDAECVFHCKGAGHGWQCLSRMSMILARCPSSPLPPADGLAAFALVPTDTVMPAVRTAPHGKHGKHTSNCGGPLKGPKR